MHIDFQFHGSRYSAGLRKKDDKMLLVEFENQELKTQFGPSLPFKVENHDVDFDILNLAHSELYELNSTISRAIKEQCADML